MMDYKTTMEALMAIQLPSTPIRGVATMSMAKWTATNHKDFFRLSKEDKATIKVTQLMVKGFKRSSDLWRIGLARGIKPLMSPEEIATASSLDGIAGEVFTYFIEEHLIPGEINQGYPAGDLRASLAWFYLEQGVSPSVMYALKSEVFFHSWTIGNSQPYCLPTVLIRTKALVEKFLAEFDSAFIQDLYEDYHAVTLLLNNIVADARQRMISLKVRNGWTRDEASDSVTLATDAEIIEALESDLRGGD